MVEEKLEMLKHMKRYVQDLQWSGTIQEIPNSMPLQTNQGPQSH